MGESGASYQVLVEFSNDKMPSREDMQRLLGKYDPNLANSTGNLLRTSDPYTGDSVSIDIGQSGVVKLSVPFTSTFRSVAAAYSVAWALADGLGGRVRDPQLTGPPSLDMARQEWRKRETSGGVAKIFGGIIPADLKTKIKQRRGMIRQEVEIRGAELEITRKAQGRTMHYYLPIMGLGAPQENTVPNPRILYMLLIGLMTVIVAIIFGGTSEAWIGGLIFLFGIPAVLAASLFVRAKYKRHVRIYPGVGGNLVLESESPSKVDVEQFLTSMDRIRFALSRNRTPTAGLPTDNDAEKMRVT